MHFITILGSPLWLLKSVTCDITSRTFRPLHFYACEQEPYIPVTHFMSGSPKIGYIYVTLGSDGLSKPCRPSCAGVVFQVGRYHICDCHYRLHHMISLVSKPHYRYSSSCRSQRRYTTTSSKYTPMCIQLTLIHLQDCLPGWLTNRSTITSETFKWGTRVKSAYMRIYYITASL